MKPTITKLQPCGEVTASTRELARAMGVKPRDVRRYLRELEQHGLVKRIHNGNGKPDTFQLFEPAQEPVQ